VGVRVAATVSVRELVPVGGGVFVSDAVCVASSGSEAVCEGVCVKLSDPLSELVRDWEGVGSGETEEDGVVDVDREWVAVCALVSVGSSVSDAVGLFDTVRVGVGGGTYVADGVMVTV